MPFLDISGEIKCRGVNFGGSYRFFRRTDNRLELNLGSNLVITGGTIAINDHGTVTQTTSKSTAVTLNNRSGTITTHNASLAAGAEVGFTVNNSTVGANDVVIANIASGATADSYSLTVDAVAAGSFRLSLSNLTAGAIAEAIAINFVVISGTA